MQQKNDVTFLVIDDDDIDVMCMKRVFKDLKIANPIVVARNGLEGLAALRGSGDFEQVKSPFIILLDLNMPRMNGIEFLDAIRQDPQLRTSVIFVLTTSKHDKDRIAAYERNIAGYVVKEKAMETLLQAIGMINSYWRVVELP